MDNAEAILTIAASARLLAREGVHYDMIAHDAHSETAETTVRTPPHNPVIDAKA